MNLNNKLVVIFVLIYLTENILSSSVFEDKWNKYKILFQKLYDPIEDKARRDQWFKSLTTIYKHELNNMMGSKYSYNLGETELMDAMPYEYISQISNNSLDKLLMSYSKKYVNSNKTLPSTVDWRKKGYVTKVKNQGKLCNSYWAFSILGAIEGQLYKKTKRLIDLSAQQLIDCMRTLYTAGCFGGVPYAAYPYTELFGVEPETSYRYVGKQQYCQYHRSKTVVRTKGFIIINAENDAVLQGIVANVGPVSVMLNVQPDFLLYRNGIYDNPKCNASLLNSAALLIGYGTYKGKDYWLIKNSWGTNWGMNGYAMLSRNKRNQCGISAVASFPFL